MKRIALAALSIVALVALAAWLTGDSEEVELAESPPLAAGAPAPQLSPSRTSEDGVLEGDEADGLTGVVLHPDGGAASGVEVLVFAQPADTLGLPECAIELDTSCTCGPVAARWVDGLESLAARSSPIARAVTRDDGTFALPLTPRETHVRLTARAGELVATLHSEIPADVELRLGAPRVHEVAVLDDDDAPVARATVLVLSDGIDRYETDGSGLAQVRLPPGEVEVLAYRQGLLPGADTVDVELDVVGGEPGRLELSLSTPRRLEGVLRDERGPVAGAEVVSNDWGCVITATTSPTGRFVLDAVPAGPHRLVASKSGRRAAHSIDVSDHDAVDAGVQFGTVGEVAGRVFDADTGAPIRNATLRLSTSDEDETALTQSDGTFVFSTVPVGRADLEVRAEGHLGVTRRIEVQADVTTRADQALQRGLELSGIVLDEARRPIARASVSGLAEGVTATRTDASGAFALRAPPGKQSVRVSADGYAQWTGELTAPATRAEITLVRAGQVVAVVVDDHDRPIARVHVGLQRRGSSRSAVTDASGRASITGLEPGDWQAIAYLADSSRFSESVTVSAGSQAHVTLKQPPQGSIVGTLVDDQGTPLGATEVAASCGAYVKTTTDAAGRFELKPVKLGALCYVHPTSERWRIQGYAKVVVTSPPKQLKLVASRSAVVKGRAVDEGGAPVERLINGVGGGYRALHAPDGRFEVAASDRPQSIWADGRAPVSLPVTSKDGADVDLGTVVLRAGRGVSGTVRDAQGQPIHGASFSAGKIQHLGTSDRTGRFELHGLPPGQVELRVHHRSYREAKVTVTDGAPPLDLVLSRGEVLHGRIVAPQGLGFGRIVAWSAGQSDIVADDGTFTLEGLEPGALLVRFHMSEDETVFVPRTETVIGAAAENRLEVVAIPRVGEAVVTFTTAPQAQHPNVNVIVGDDDVPAPVVWASSNECRVTRLPLGSLMLLFPRQDAVPLEVRAGMVARAQLGP